MLLYRPYILLTEYRVIKIPVGYAGITLPPAGHLNLKRSPVHEQEKTMEELTASYATDTCIPMNFQFTIPTAL